MTAKNDVRLTAYRDGPLLVRGPAGNAGTEPLGISRAVALCRCGRSRLWPTCDGTHKLVGFRAPAREIRVSGAD